jgi:hypothetical protein
VVPVVSFLAPEREYVAPVVPKWMIPASCLAPEPSSGIKKWHHGANLQDDMDVLFGTRSGTRHIWGLVVPVASCAGTVALNDRRVRSRTDPTTLRPVCQSLVMDTESNQKDIAAKKHRSCTFSACCSYAAEWQRYYTDS